MVLTKFYNFIIIDCVRIKFDWEVRILDEQRASFETRVSQLGGELQTYYLQLKNYLLSFKKVKSRLSNRCDSYRFGRELLCKMAIGGKTLKIYLNVDTTNPEVEEKKIHFRDMASSKAYEEVPAMIPVRSELCVKKVCEVIDIMMAQKGIVKKK